MTDIASTVQRLQPDLIIADPQRQRSIDIAALTELSQAAPATRVVIHSRIGAPSEVLRAVPSGARGYLLKRSETSAAFVLDALALIADYGAVVLDPRVGERLSAPPAEAQLVRARHGPVPHISDRQSKILGLLAAGCTESQIASREGVGWRTVNRDITSLEEKLNVSSLFALAVKATQLHLIP